MDDYEQQLIAAALGYAKRNWSVFPCFWILNGRCACGNPDCASPGKHPLIPGGFLNAVTDEEVIRAWWGKYPSANIGIATGQASGIDVVDVDDPETALPLLTQFVGDLKAIPRQKSGRDKGGWHFVFSHAPGVTNHAKFLPGMDTRGDGGYIIVAPSTHVSGRQYRWLYLPPDNSNFPELPKSLLEAINRVNSSNGFKPRFDTAAALKGAPEGERRDTIFKLSAKLRQADVPIDIAEKLVRESWEKCDQGTHPFPWTEASAQLNDVYRRYPAGNSTDEVDSEKKLQEWLDPQALPDKLPPVPAMVAKLVPNPFRDWLCDIADRMQCPLDFPVIAAVVAIASLIGRRLAIRPKKEDDWTVVPNLWGAVVGRPGIMKTPALDEAKRPLQRLELQALKDHEKRKHEHELKLMVLKAQKEELQKKIKEAIVNGTSTEGFAVPQEEELILPRYMVNDSTVEKLGEILNQNSSVLLFRDELTGWLRTLDREGHENDRAFYLESWNGNGSYTYDRIGRGTLNIEAACVSILGGIQPGPLNDYLESTLKGGAGADGLFQRLQLLVYPDDPGPWKNIDRWPNTEAKNAAFEVFKKLAGEGFVGFVTSFGGVSPEENENPAIPFLRFSPKGQELFDEWRGELENKIRTGDEHPAVEAHLSKYRSLMPSLALIFHVVSTLDQEQATPVSEGAAKMAAAWCDYLEAHARRVYHGLIQRDVSTVHRLAKKITGSQLPNPFTARDVYRKHWTGLLDAEVIEAGATILDELGWIKTMKVSNGGRPTLEYQINPQLLRQES